MSTWVAHGSMSYWVLLLFMEPMLMITATKISASSTRPARPWKSVNLGKQSCQSWKTNCESCHSERVVNVGKQKWLLLHLVLNCVDLSDFPTRLPSIWSPQMPASQLIDCNWQSGKYVMFKQTRFQSSWRMISYLAFRILGTLSFTF